MAIILYFSEAEITLRAGWMDGWMDDDRGILYGRYYGKTILYIRYEVSLFLFDLLGFLGCCSSNNLILRFRIGIELRLGAEKLLDDYCECSEEEDES
mmetsp:Transcript_8885/g.16033  ORF Transcript_8885/g.16033 Transcript_8885/m.16033 type:complete len:97 (+) Transcript_8885:220-510(+)